MNIIRFLPKYPDFGVNARQCILYIFFIVTFYSQENSLKFVFFWRTGLTTASRGHLNTTRLKATIRKAVQALSFVEASLYRMEAEEKVKESARGTMGRRKIYERLPSFLSSRRPGAPPIFPLLLFILGYQVGASAEEREVREKGNKQQGRGSKLVLLTLVWNRPASFPFLV